MRVPFLDTVAAHSTPSGDPLDPFSAASQHTASKSILQWSLVSSAQHTSIAEWQSNLFNTDYKFSDTIGMGVSPVRGPKFHNRGTIP